jgi:hypothetical protein
VNQGDPTDNALATIASILDQPEAPRRGQGKPLTAEKPAAEEKPAAAVAVEADGYTKIGPGPLAAIRFKWTVRRADDGQYYVHETIGDSSAPVVTGPLSWEAAVWLVDTRETEARTRFERLKSEMAVGSDTAELIRLGGGEI